MVESQPSKLLVAGSIPVSRSIIFCRSYILRVVNADVAQLVEHSLGKGEVIGSIPIISSILARPNLIMRPSLAEGCCGFGEEAAFQHVLAAKMLQKLNEGVLSGRSRGRSGSAREVRENLP